MRYKREAEVPAEALDPRAAGDPAAEASGESLSLPATAEVVVQPAYSTVEDVLARGGDGPSSSSAGARDVPDASSLEFIGLEDCEVSMSQGKWHEVNALERVQRMIEAKKVEIGNSPDWKVDVAEIFSPPRFTQHAGRLGLKPGCAIDLSTGWGLDRPEDVIKMDKMIEEQPPLLLTGGFDCAPFRVLRNINRSYLNTKENVEKRQKGENHLSLCIERYRRQIKKKRYFLHEHPAGADSWDEEEIQRLQQEPDVFTVAGPMCAWGMTIHAKRKGSGLVYKDTKWVTNSPEIAEVLDQHCRNRRGGPIHRHVALIGGLAKLAEAYPDELVVSVLEGLRRQMKADGSLSSIEMYASGPDPTEHLFPEESHQAVDEELEKYYDVISGEELPANLVRDARQERKGSDTVDQQNRPLHQSAEVSGSAKGKDSASCALGRCQQRRSIPNEVEKSNC